MHAKSKLFSAAVLSAAAGTLIVLGCTHSSQCCDDDTQPLTQENAVAGDTVLGGEKPTCRAVLAGEGLSERASPYEYVHDDQFGTHMDTSTPRRVESAVTSAGSPGQELRTRTDIYGTRFADHPANYEYVYVEQLGVYLEAVPARLAVSTPTDTHLMLPRDMASDTTRNTSRDSGTPSSEDETNASRASSEPALIFTPIARADSEPPAAVKPVEPKETLQSLISSWSEEQRLLIGKLSDKYGPPTEISASAVTWKEKGDFLSVKVTKDSASHHFPAKHRDCLSQTVAFKVPTELAGDVLAFNGSLIIDRTRGTLTASCDSEEMNTLALNLAYDIVNRSRSVEEARTSMRQTTLNFKNGMQDPYTTKLQFDTGLDNAADPDSADDSTSAHAFPNR